MSLYDAAKIVLTAPNAGPYTFTPELANKIIDFYDSIERELRVSPGTEFGNGFNAALKQMKHELDERWGAK